MEMTVVNLDNGRKGMIFNSAMNGYGLDRIMDELSTAVFKAEKHGIDCVLVAPEIMRALEKSVYTIDKCADITAYFERV